MNELKTIGLDLQAHGELPAELRGPDWVQANPVQIEEALQRALRLPSGGWYVLDSSRAIGSGPLVRRVAGRELVVWRGLDGPIVAPNACPHMGAALSDGHVCDGRVVCPWHGLALATEPTGAWQPLEAFDDGVLTWVRLDDVDSPTDRPFLPQRPTTFMDAVIRVEANCEPRDVIANRLDPWHGVHFHPHSFKRLKVIALEDDHLVARVVYGIGDRFGIEVDAQFHCADPRTIVMTIVAGEGTGSVVETHATPLEDGRTAIIEATLATSDRPGFRRAMKAVALIRPFMRSKARRLWVEDAAYAERRFALRKGAMP